MSSSRQRFTDIDLSNKRLPACYGYITSRKVPIEQAMMDVGNSLPEISRFVKLAKKHCTYPNDHNLDKDEAAAIYLYTMEMSDEISIYRALNQTLRLEDRSRLRPWFSYLKLLDSGVSKLPKVKDTIWRGIDKDVSYLFRRGQKVTWWSISSCSKSVDIISSFLGHVAQSTLFSIQCSNGRSIAAYTCYPNENEVILMPGTAFQVVADPLHHHGGLHVIHLKEITEDDDDDDDNDQPIGTIAAANPNTFKQAPIETKFNSLTLGSSRSYTPINNSATNVHKNAQPYNQVFSTKPPSTVTKSLPPPSPSPTAKLATFQYVPKKEK